MKEEDQLSAWFSQAKQGDKLAYECFLRKVAEILKPYLKKRLAQASDSEDVLQEVLLTIDKIRHTYDFSRPLWPWLYAIAQKKLLDYLRRHYRQKQQEWIDIDSIAESLGKEDHDPDLPTELMQQLLSLLPEKTRILLYLLHQEGYTAQEVADKVGMRVSAVKVAAHRAYKILHKHLTENYE
jgi:RNA polymerase sigma-70 factor (ECF subfamily)